MPRVARTFIPAAKWFITTPGAGISSFLTKFIANFSQIYG
jgi:hypothetical protein